MMTVSNNDQDRHFHGFDVKVVGDGVSSYSTVYVNDTIAYEGPVAECNHLAAMLENVSESVKSATLAR